MSAGENTTARGIALVALVTLVLSGSFVAGRLARAGGDPSRFAFAGDQWVNASQAPPSLYIYKDSFGFDGVGFYRIALDPLTRDRTAFGITFDLPAFRFQRILYPILTWAVTGGNPDGVAWALIAWNLLGMAALGLVGALLAVSMGRKPFWGLLLALAPAFAVSLGLDTAEILAGALLMAGLWLLRRNRYPGATAALTLAALARETTLIVSVAGTLLWILGRIRKKSAVDYPPLWTFLIPAVVQGAWQLVLWKRWGKFGSSQGTAVDIGLPFKGLARAIQGWLPPDTALDVLHLTLFIAIGFFTWTVIRSLRSSKAPSYERAAWVLMGVLLPFFQFAIWFHYWGFLRALSEFTILGILIVLNDEDAPRHRLLLLPALWISVALQLALYP